MQNYFAITFSFDSSDGNSGLYLVLIFCLFLAVRYGFRYLIFRKRLRAIKKRNVVIAEYTAPPDIPPAFFGTIVDNRPSVQDLAATILSLHLKGHLHLHYREDKKDFHIQSTRLDNDDSLYEHEKFILQYIAGREGLWAIRLKEDTINIVNQFNFLVLRDLQQAAYYRFHKKMESMSYSEYYFRVIKQSIIRGVRKPWNWPGFLLSIVLPIYGLVWLVASIVFYNRLGMYNYRTDKWEKLWPKVAGYYNYLRSVEAEKRSFAIQDIANFKISEHDPYLVAALLQTEWSHIFSNHLEVGASGKEYNTY
jgi:hypothetical protein